MQTLEVFLFGKIMIRYAQETEISLKSQKMQELFCYLLLYRNRPHYRECLADKLWKDINHTHSKNYLRKTIWQLKNEIDKIQSSSGECIFLIEPNWIQINPDKDIWIDVAEFEKEYESFRELRGIELNAKEFEQLNKIVQFYRGDLYEGCFEDWCIFERERYKDMYLSIILKLMNYCEDHGHFDSGIEYAKKILNIDNTHERVHRGLMRLYCLSGHRAGGLRQFQECKEILHREFSIKPCKKTIALVSKIQNDEFPEKPISD